MKAQILSILKDAKGAVSGEAMGSRLGISRVAVFKQIGKLREAGYAIDSGSGGYRLRREPDALFPWVFPGREDRIHYFPETGSTMDPARDLARKECPPFTVVAADVQTRGRGRLERSWLSGRGGLYFTVVTRPALGPDACHQVLFTASVVLAQILVDGYAINARLKWPNDILVGNRKIAGMLSEMEAQGDRVRYVNIGIGINVNNDISQVQPPAVSMKTLLGRKVLRREILSEFLDAFEAALEPSPFPQILSRWKALSDTLGRPVRIVTLKETLEGTALDLDSDGALRLQQENGTIRRIVYGDCFHA